MNKGFTLLELLVVVAIMGMLGVAATGGYNALTRGMADRGAATAASTFLKAAQERAHVDRMPTVVFCYNRLLNEPDLKAERNGVVVGVMTAIRRIGRITDVVGQKLYDEFGDLDQTYETSDDEGDLRKGGGFRLFRMPGSRLSKMQYSIVSDRVYFDEMSRQATLFSLAENNGKTNIPMCAFFDLQTSKHAPPQWKVGDGYAIEFAEIELPRGYVFGQNVPGSAADVTEVKAFNFDPDENVNETVDVYSTKPDASGYPKVFKKAGSATSDPNAAI